MYLIMSWFANVSNCRNCETLSNSYFDFFQHTKLANKAEDSCLKINKYYVIFRKFDTYQIAFHMICQQHKTRKAILQFVKIGVLVNFIIQAFKFCKIAPLFCASVSNTRENLRELREFLFHKIRTWVYMGSM